MTAQIAERLLYQGQTWSMFTNPRPRKEVTLMMTIQALVKQRTNQPISDANLKKLLAELKQRGQVTITEGKVVYKL